MASYLRLYEAADAGQDGYPPAWHSIGGGVGIKHLIRARAGDRCLRCGHPYSPGEGEWSRCDEECSHPGPTRSMAQIDLNVMALGDEWPPVTLDRAREVWTEAQWRILTVHHLNENKLDCRWWNLVALCQRDHLYIQRKVKMQRPWPWPHSAWFKPYVAGFYAWEHLGQDLSRQEVLERMDELLALGAREAAVERMPL